jgi:hypothetical protein
MVLKYQSKHIKPEVRQAASDAINYYMYGGYIDEMTTDKKYYCTKLVEYVKLADKDFMESRVMWHRVVADLYKDIRRLDGLRAKYLKQVKELKQKANA